MDSEPPIKKQRIIEAVPAKKDSSVQPSATPPSPPPSTSSSSTSSTLQITVDASESSDERQKISEREEKRREAYLQMGFGWVGNEHPTRAAWSKYCEEGFSMEGVPDPMVLIDQRYPNWREEGFTIPLPDRGRLDSKSPSKSPLRSKSPSPTVSNSPQISPEDGNVNRFSPDLTYVQNT